MNSCIYKHNSEVKDLLFMEAFNFPQERNETLNTYAHLKLLKQLKQCLFITKQSSYMHSDSVMALDEF